MQPDGPGLGRALSYLSRPPRAFRSGCRCPLFDPSWGPQPPHPSRAASASARPGGCTSRGWQMPPKPAFFLSLSPRRSFWMNGMNVHPSANQGGGPVRRHADVLSGTVTGRVRPSPTSRFAKIKVDHCHTSSGRMCPGILSGFLNGNPAPIPGISQSS